MLNIMRVIHIYYFINIILNIIIFTRHIFKIMQIIFFSLIQYDTGEMDELIVAMGRTENALNVDLINSAELNTTSTEPSCCQNSSTRVKKRQKFVLVRQMLDAKVRGEYVFYRNTLSM